MMELVEIKEFVLYNMKNIEEVEQEIEQAINRERHFYQEGRKNLDNFIRINGL